MARAEFFGFTRDPSRQRPLSLPPYENRVDATCGLASPRVLKKQSPVGVTSVDTRGTVNSVSYTVFHSDRPDVTVLTHVKEHRIYLGPREYREQRKLKRMSEFAKNQALASVSAIC